MPGRLAGFKSASISQDRPVVPSSSFWRSDCREYFDQPPSSVHRLAINPYHSNQQRCLWPRKKAQVINQNSNNRRKLSASQWSNSQLLKPIENEFYHAVSRESKQDVFNSLPMFSSKYQRLKPHGSGLFKIKCAREEETIPRNNQQRDENDGNEMLQGNDQNSNEEDVSHNQYPITHYQAVFPSSSEFNAYNPLRLNSTYRYSSSGPKTYHHQWGWDKSCARLKGNKQFPLPDSLVLRKKDQIEALQRLSKLKAQIHMAGEERRGDQHRREEARRDFLAQVDEELQLMSSAKLAQLEAAKSYDRLAGAERVLAEKDKRIHSLLEKEDKLYAQLTDAEARLANADMSFIPRISSEEQLRSFASYLNFAF